MSALNDLMSKLEESERENLKKKGEIMSLKKVQNIQGNALNKIANEQSHAEKINNLMTELKFKKNKMRDLEDKLKQEEKVTIQVRTQNL